MNVIINESNLDHCLAIIYPFVIGFDGLEMH